MHGSVHSRRPSRLRSHSSPIPVHSSCLNSVVALITLLPLLNSRRLASSRAAPARAVVVVLTVSRRYFASDSFAFFIKSSWSTASDEEFTGTVYVNGDDVKRGENQSPRKSKKHRSDQWQDEMNRISSSAEQ